MAHCVQPEASVFRGRYTLFCFGKVMHILQCLTRYLTCVLLPWANEMQWKMWDQVVIFPMLFPSGKTSKPLLTSLRICFLLGCVAACSYQPALTLFCVSNVTTLECYWWGFFVCLFFSAGTPCQNPYHVRTPAGTMVPRYVSLWATHVWQQKKQCTGALFGLFFFSFFTWESSPK